MYYNMPCWNCGKPLRASDEMVGRRARCPYCNAVGEIAPPPQPPLPPTPPAQQQSVGEAEGFTVPGPVAGPTEPTPPGQAPAESSRGTRRHGTSVSLSLSACLGLAGAVVFYAALIYPLPDNVVRRLFAGRGVVPYVIAFLTFWAFAILVLKFRMIRVQRSALLFDALPKEVAHEIRPGNVEAFRSNLLSLPIPPEDSFLIGRVLRALEHYRVHPNTEGVATLLSTQSEIDSNTVESSYTMTRVLIWAIPILGFIGTVMGVGDAVGSFSQVIGAAKDFASVKDSLGNVTSGLGVAFDTTLLALVMSLLVMFPASALQKSEEDLLTSVDQYCNENVLRRLGGQQEAGASPQDRAAMADQAEQVLQQLRQDMDAWTAKMQQLGGQVARDVAEAWDRVRESAEQARQRQASAAAEGGESLVEAANAVRERLADTTREVSRLAEAHEGLTDVSRALLERAESVVGDGELRGALASLNDQVARNTEVLIALGDQLRQVPEPMAIIEPEMEPETEPAARRGWWPFGKR